MDPITEFQRFIGPPIVQFAAQNGRLMEVLLVIGIAFFSAKNGQVPAIIYDYLFGKKGTSKGHGDVPRGDEPPQEE